MSRRWRNASTTPGRRTRRGGYRRSGRTDNGPRNTRKEHGKKQRWRITSVVFFPCVPCIPWSVPFVVNTPRQFLDGGLRMSDPLDLGTTTPLVPPLYQSAVYTLPDLDALDAVYDGAA